MPCSIDNLQVIGETYPNSSALKSITITGTAVDCQHVTVEIECTGQGSAKHENIPVNGGQWQTTFTDQEVKDAGCKECENPGYPIKVRVSCSDPLPANCPVELVLAEIPCGYCCPTVSGEVTEVEADCNAQGERIVHFKVTITPDPACTDLVVASVDFGDGTNSPPIVVPPDSPWTGTHAYNPNSGTNPSNPGWYTAYVKISHPTDCPDFGFRVGPLQPCPPGCPTAADITVAPDDCDDQGRRIVALTISLTGTGSTSGSIDWGDGVTDPSITINAPQTTVFHHYQPGTYTATVTVEGCPPITKQISVEGCDGDGNGGHPCPPWWPFCHGWNLCAALQALAEVFIVGAAISLIVAGCGGDYAAALISMLVYFAIAAGLFYLWYSFCAKSDASFCDTLDQLIHFLYIWLFIQPILMGVAGAIAGLISYLTGTPLPIWPCEIGAVLSWAYFGAIFTYLLEIRHLAHCPGEAPTHI